MAAKVGAPETVFVEGLQRMLGFRDGMAYLRPAIDGLGRAIYQSLNQVDIFAIYPEVRCHLLFVNASPADHSGPGDTSPLWMSDLTRAFRKGQMRDLAALVAGNPNVRFETLKAAMGSCSNNQQRSSR